MSRVTWAIVPVKQLSQAKRRLARVLPVEARRRLVLAMLQEVLATLAQVDAINAVLVVTPDAQAAEVAHKMESMVLREPRVAGLNAAVRQGLAYAREHGASQALVLPADVPLATPDELSRVVENAADSSGPRVVLVPSHDGEGTNALLLSPPGILPPSFGPGSFLRHLAQAVARKLDVQVLQLPGLANDVDERRDLERLVAHKQGSDIYSFLEAHLSKPADRPQRPTRGTES
jgi:2-phospho-L-lactate/phosphoenolpyruvate guanylyltransferase